MKVDNTSTEVPPSSCAGCGKSNDMATATTGKHKPKAGDVSVCFYCGHIAVFGSDMRLRGPTSNEMHEIAGDPLILRIQKTRALIGKKP